jgi:Family of unknown function (DUF5752)
MLIENSGSIDSVAARKILRPLSYAEGFHFFLQNGAYTGETATSLLVFSKDLEVIEIESLRYHFQRGDFQAWIRTTLDDPELAKRFDTVEQQVSDVELRKQLIEILRKRLAELKSLAQRS